MSSRERRTAGEAGFTLIELMIVVVVVSVLAAIAIPRFQDVRVKASLASVVADARILYSGLEEFYATGYQYPNASSSPAFDLTTFEPLRSVVEYQGSMNERLLNGRADLYDSPDDRGSNQEFWMQMTLRIDPSYQVVVAISDDAPLGGGQWLQGVYTFHNGVMVGGPGM